MADWKPLRARLHNVETLTLTWGDLDDLVGGLPSSASNYAAFWSGERSAWAGFRTRDVTVGQSVTFQRSTQKVLRRGRPDSHSVAMRSSPASSAVVATNPGIVLIGCVKEKLGKPAAAQDLYVSALFQKERRYAEASGAVWYILSAEHGLVVPDEILGPYDLQLSRTPADYRRAWGIRVVNRLLDVYGDLIGVAVELHAGAAYVEPIRSLLQGEGAVVVEPLAGLTLGPRLSWYNRTRPNPGGIDAVTPSGAPLNPADFIAILQDRTSALTPREFLETKGANLRRPGLYSWWVDVRGASDLTAGIGHVVEPGLIYAGLAGATRERSGRKSSNTLWGRISTMHLGGRHEFSTFRLSLGSALANGLGWERIDEAALSVWMHDHLKVVAVPVADADTLGQLETGVLASLDPPLNLSKVAKTDVRRQLALLRRRYSAKRRRVR